MQTVSEWWMWLLFFALIGVMLLVDMFLLGGKKAHQVPVKESLSWVIVWITISLSFNLFFWWYLSKTGPIEIANKSALEFLTGYLIEKSLSVDNLFVFIMIFHYFAVPAELQKRVLLLGVLGAIFLRLLMILLGVWLVAQFHWILLLFGVFLVFTGIKMLLVKDEKPNLNRNPLIRWMRKHMKVTENYHQEKFSIVENGQRYLTPLFLVLVLIEFSDLIFALDSIPAIFAITQDPFIVVTSNIFAILGLRSLYFLLAKMADTFYLLKYGIALILIFVGAKMLVESWFEIPILITLVIISIILVACAILSRVFAKKSNI